MREADEPAGTERRPLHLTANLFAVAFGLAGLAEAWSTATQLAGASDWPGNVLWILTALTWMITLAAYLANVAAQRRWTTELSDPTFGPFTAIELAPPVVAGNSWFAINGGRVDTPAAILAGLSLLSLLVQFRLIPMYRRATFGALAGILTAGFALLAARTVTGLIQGTFLPRVPAPDQAPG